MTYRRISEGSFDQAHSGYAAATVTFYKVNLDGSRSTTLATIYAGPTGSTLAANPQTLDSSGQYLAPVYIEEPVIAVVGTSELGDYETGIIRPPEGLYDGGWVGGKDYTVGTIIKDENFGADTENLYIATEDHTSGTWATDLGNGLWDLFVDVEAVTDARDQTVDAADSIVGSLDDIAVLAPIADTLGAVIDAADTITGVFDNLDTISTVYGDLDAITGVYGNLSTISAVNSVEETIAGAWDNIDAILGCYNALSIISSVHNNTTEIEAVYNNLSDIGTVADDIDKVSDIADNLDDLLAITTLRCTPGNTVNLPASPSDGDLVRAKMIGDFSSSAGTVGRNGNNIGGAAADFTYSGVIDTVFYFCFDSVAGGWAVG